MAPPYILARTMLDANVFARETLGLDKGHYRIVTSPSSISGRRGTDLYLIPGWEKRMDRFAMRGALKYTRLNIIDTALDEQAEAPVVTDGLEPAGEQLALISDEEADAFLVGDVRDLEASLEPLGWTPPETLSSEQVLALAANPDSTGSDALDEAEEPAKRTRRRRCPECGDLVEPQDIEQHAADHFPTEK